jgi:NDP-sugar pyrophosphorylase family protein
MKCLVLAAGRGTRLGKLTQDTPKCLIRVKNRPVIDHVLFQLSQHGFNEVMVNVSYLKDQVINYLGDRVMYYYEPMLLNTAGTVLKTAEWFDDTILVVNADTINNANYTDLVRVHKNKANGTTVLSYKNKCAGAYVIDKRFALDNFKIGKTIDECIKIHYYLYNQKGLQYTDIGTPDKLKLANGN